MTSPVQSQDHEGSPMNKEKLRWEGFVEMVGLRLEWRWMMRAGMMRDWLTSEWGGESRQYYADEGDAYLNERYIITTDSAAGGQNHELC